MLQDYFAPGLRWSLRLRGGNNGESTHASPAQSGLEETTGSDDAWKAFCKFADAKGLPAPPSDPDALPKIVGEDAEEIFRGGGVEGIDDPRLRYLFSVIPDFGKPRQPFETIEAGDIVEVRPPHSHGARTPKHAGRRDSCEPLAGACKEAESGESLAAKAAQDKIFEEPGFRERISDAGYHCESQDSCHTRPYHAQVLSLPMLLASQSAADVRAHEYEFVPNLLRFERISRAGLNRSCDDLKQSYSQRQFVEQFYPQLAGEFIEIFEAVADSHTWLVAVALGPDGTELLQKIPRSWVRVVQPTQLPDAAGKAARSRALVEDREEEPRRAGAWGGDASLQSRLGACHAAARSEPAWAAASGSFDGQGGREPAAGGQGDVMGAPRGMEARSPRLHSQMQDLFRAAQEGNVSLVEGLIKHAGKFKDDRSVSHH